MFDSGICDIYTVEWDERTIPKTCRRTLCHTLQFGDRTVGMTRQYEAGRNDQRVDRLIRIWRTPVTTQQICAIDGVDYIIRQIQNKTDDDGLYVTELALEVNGDV